MELRNFSPAELHQALPDIVLIDVREPHEFASARIDGAILHPLSSFDPTALPPGEIVLQCGIGKRSATAAALCDQAGVKIAGHLAGGLAAWAQAGLPVARS